MNGERKKEEFKQTDIEKFGTLIIKFLIVCCLPWIIISKLDRQFDENSEEGFEPWNFYWSFPATHLSWLALTFLFGLPLWGLIGAPAILFARILRACLLGGTVDVSLFTSVIGAIIVVPIWIGLYRVVNNYRSKREIREVRGEVYREELKVNEE